MSAVKSIHTGKDVIAFLKHQHEQIKTMFENVIETEGEERTEAFVELRRLLAVHETAEEEVIHPTARRELAGGEEIVSMRLSEENHAKKTLAKLEKLEVDSEEFENEFEALRAAVVSHAEAEETLEFAGLAHSLEATTLERMKKAAEFAESIAPTRPHAGAESSVANMLVGPFAAMVDRSRDLLSSHKRRSA